MLAVLLLTSLTDRQVTEVDTSTVLGQLLHCSLLTAVGPNQGSMKKAKVILTWKLKSSRRKARLLRGTWGVLMGMLPAAPPWGATRLALSGNRMGATRGQ